MKRLLLQWLTVTLTALVCGGCIKIESGGVEEAREPANAEARRTRAKWADQFQNATPEQMADLVIRHVGFATDNYLRMGRDVLYEWRRGEEGRGESIPGSEMVGMVEAWISSEKPVLKAWEDNLEYGLDRIRETNRFDQPHLDALSAVADQFYISHSFVMYPAGSSSDYASGLDDLERETETLIEDTRYKLGLN